MNSTVFCPQCGTRLSPGPAGGECPRCLLAAGLEQPTGPAGLTVAELEELLPNLEILGEIGFGGMGVVYQARQRNLDRIVALKILQPRESSGFAERFAQEARALARLTHPHIVALHEFGEIAGLYYLILEYVDGPNLRQVLEKQRLDPKQALSIVPQICEALQFAHDRGVVHRDIKPENVLLDRRGQVKITDFGLAKLLQHPADTTRLTRADQVMGTVHYMAPEQYQTPDQVDHRADIYSLGVVFYEMLTGQLPLGKFDPPSRKVAVDVRIDEVVLRALEEEPTRRFQHASDVSSKVDSISHSRPKGRASNPRGSRPRLSKLALASFLALPVCFILLTASVYLAASTGGSLAVRIFSFALGATFLFSFASAIISFIRIPTSKGRLRGLGWAIAAFVLCFPCFGAVFLLFTAASVANNPEGTTMEPKTVLPDERETDIPSDSFDSVQRALIQDGSE